MSEPAEWVRIVSAMDDNHWNGWGRVFSVSGQHRWNWVSEPLEYKDTEPSRHQAPELLTWAYHAAVHLAERTDLAGLSSSDMLPSSKRWRFWCLSVEQFLHHGFT